MTITRDEFDRLAQRVDRLEAQNKALTEIIAAEVVGLSSRIEHVDRKADSILTIVTDVQSDVAGIKTTVSAIAEHFGID